MNKIKNTIRFMLSPQGLCERWQYIWGTICLNVISIALVLFLIALSPLSGIIYVIWLLIALYSQFCLIQKRCRAIGKNATIFILLISAMHITCIWNQNNLLDAYIILQATVALIVLLGWITHLYLMCKKNIAAADVNQTSWLMRHPMLITLGVWLIIVVEMFFVALLQADIYKEERIYNLAFAQGLIYRNTKGYIKVCQDNGYTMQNYPAVFMAQVQEENDYITQELSKSAINNLTPEELPQNLADNIINELEQIRAIIARSYQAVKQQETPETVDVTPSDIDKVTIKDACEFIDKVYAEQVANSQAVMLIKKTVADLR